MNKIQKSASHINLMFLIALLPGLIACTFMIGKASASPLDDYCERQFNISFMQKLHPVAKKCESRFKIITDQWVGFKINK